jgi:methionyl-tRNA formyltransferase
MFGATAHRMTEQVDAGPIVGIETFAIPDNIGVRELEQIAFVRLAYLFWRLSRDLATRPEPLPALPLRWSGIKSTRRMYASMCQITPAMPPVELARRVAAFHDDFRAIYPTITLHGFQFRLAPGPARPIDMEPGPSARSVEAPLQVALDAPALAHG